ncbi:MAG: YceI family protein [Candidatus Dormibacterales bacterium]
MGKWKFDPMHTQVEFSAKHLGMMTVRGHFAEVAASGELDPEQPERSSIEVTMNTASIRTNNQRRDDDLRSSSLLEVEKYPTITFRSTRIEPAGPDRYTLTGDLTIKDTTHPVSLDAVRYGEFNDPQMGHRIGYAAEGRISRQDFGMKFEMILDGRLVVGDEIQIHIEGELLEAPEDASG